MLIRASGARRKATVLVSVVTLGIGLRLVGRSSGRSPDVLIAHPGRQGIRRFAGERIEGGCITIVMATVVPTARHARPGTVAIREKRLVARGRAEADRRQVRRHRRRHADDRSMGERLAEIDLDYAPHH